MTTIYFVRHAQPGYNWIDDRTRPLTAEGIRDSERFRERECGAGAAGVR